MFEPLPNRLHLSAAQTAMQVKHFHWPVGILLSGTIHALFFVWLFASEVEPVPSAAPGGEGGILIALADPSAMPEQKEEQIEAGKTQARPPKKERDKEQEPKRETDKTETQPTPPEKAERKEAKPVKKRPVQPQQKSRQKPAQTHKKTEKRAPGQKLRQGAKPAPPAPTQSALARADVSAPSVPTGTPSLVGSGGHQAMQDYRMALRVWLERHRRYPKRAVRRRIEGKGILYFRLDRNGNVLTRELRVKTGNGLLDREILATLQRASPLPPVPGNLSGKTLDFTIPIEFSIR